MLSIVYLVHFLVVGQAVYGDGRMYYSYARAMAIRNSLDISQELNHRWTSESNNDLVPHVEEQYSFDYPHQTVGPILFWSLVLKVVNFVVIGFNSVGAKMLIHVYSDLYHYTVGFATILAFTLSNYLLYLNLIKKVKPIFAIYAIIFFCFTTNLFYYSSIDLLNTHAFSYILSVLILIRFLNKTSLGVLDGLLFGMLISNRTNDAVIYFPFLLSLILRDFFLEMCYILCVGFCQHYRLN